MPPWVERDAPIEQYSDVMKYESAGEATKHICERRFRMYEDVARLVIAGEFENRSTAVAFMQSLGFSFRFSRLSKVWEKMGQAPQVRVGPQKPKKDKTNATKQLKKTEKNHKNPQHSQKKQKQMQKNHKKNRKTKPKTKTKKKQQQQQQQQNINN